MSLFSFLPRVRSEKYTIYNCIVLGLHWILTSLGPVFAWLICSGMYVELTVCGHIKQREAETRDTLTNV